MKICYSRTFGTFSSEASTFPKNEFPFFSAGLVAFMNSALGNIWMGWEKRQSLHTSRIWQRTTRISKYKLACHDRNLNFRGEITDMGWITFFEPPTVAFDNEAMEKFL
jgi:hypothetical protein